MSHPPVVLASLAVPLLAAGAATAAVGVPVLIHLLTRQRPQVVEWAAVRFLQATQKAARRRVDRWLVLLARVLLLLALVAGMVSDTPWAERLWQWLRPAPMAAGGDAPRTHRVIVLDAGLGMSARRPDGASRFEAAVEQAGRILATANPGDGFSLIVVGVGAEAVVPGPSADSAKVLAELQAVKPTHAAGDLQAGLTLAADTLAKSPRAYPRRQLLVVTDLRKAAWAGLLAKPDGSKPDLWGRILPRADVAVVDAAGGETDNLAVVDLQLADPLPLAGGPAAVTATVQNFGRTVRKPVRLELLVGRAGGSGDVPLLPVESRAVPELPAGQRASVTFALENAGRFREPGPHLLQVRLTDADDLPADDRRTLAVDVKGGLTALLVNGQAAAVPLKRSAGYLFEALAPGGRSSPGNPARPKLLTLSEFADPALGDLSAADAVFLCDVPTISPAEVARLDAHLKRGGGVVIGLGPNAAAAAELYNRVLFADGAGLLPGKILGVAGGDGADAPGFRLVADEDSFRRPPLAAFADDNARAGLTSVPFRKYVKLDAPADGKGRRVLSFAPLDGSGDARPDPAVVELPRHRGRVLVYTSTFNGDWTDWPVLPSFLPFAHELLRHAATGPDPHTVRVGESLESMLPAATVGLSARLTGPDGITADAPVTADADVGAVRFADTRLAGRYRVSVPGRPDQTFAVNPAGGTESDLRRLDPDELKTLGPIAVVSDPADAPAGDPGDGPAVLTPRPHGPTIARWLLSVSFLIALLEGVLAWRAGPGRGRVTAMTGATPLRPVGLTLAAVPLLVAVGLLLVVLHAEVTGNLLGFLPDRVIDRLEAALGVPTAPTGEDVRWRLESRPAYRATLPADRGVLALMGVAAVGLAAFLYARERRAAGRWSRVVPPLLLRTAAYAVLLTVLLPQLRLAFEREGFPDVAVLLDTSESMATIDPPAKPGDATPPPRIKQAQQILAGGDGDLLGRLLAERRVRVHVYSIAEQARLAAEVGEAAELPAGRSAVTGLAADGPGSRLGDGVQQVLKAFRGGSLAGVVVLTDGVVTAGDDLPAAGRAAGRAGVPLYTVGFGDAREPTDLALTDFKADDVVLKGDELVVEARLTARGSRKPGDVPVTLYERQGEKLVKRGTVSVTPDPAGKPVPVRVTTTPAEVGEKTFVLDVPAEPGEAEAGNNRIERVVLVTESRKLKVLYVEGYPRYEFRFVKALLERETEADKPGRAVELSTWLLDASAGYADLDRSAVRGLPTRTELFEYDLLVLGDVDPAALPKQAFADIVEFVKTRGGGLMLVAGPQSNPGKLFGTPLADLLPVVPSEAAAPPTEFAPFQPKLTPLGRSHPLFRFAPDESENARLWAGLRPLNWFATGYRRKLSAEVLAVHPDRPAEGQPGEQHPLVLQQFAGSGRVLFVGFDDSWRWRFRADEERFNQYWRQAGRFLARSRPSRTELRTDKQTAYRRDEPIRLTVRFPDDAPAPPPEAAVKVVVERTSGGAAAEPQTVSLAKVDGTRATYQTLLTRTPEGDYRFRLVEPTPPGTPPRAEAKVLPPAGERDRLDLDVGALTRAAAEGHGKFYLPAEAGKLIDDLPEAARVPLNQPVPPLPVWNQAAVFGLMAALFGAEWLLRRRERLV